MQESILIIDDAKEVRKFVFEYVFEPHGFKGIEAEDGADGLKKMMQHKPDLILLDVHMPKMTGIQVLEHMQARGLEIPVIIITSHGSEAIAIEVFRMGVKNYVKKPFYPEEMLDVIEEALRETRLRKEKEILTNRILLANQELQGKIQFQEAVFILGQRINSNEPIDDILRYVLDATIKTSHSDKVDLFFGDGDIHNLWSITDDEITIDRLTSFPALVKKSMKTQRSYSFSGDKLPANLKGEFQHILVLPLIAESKSPGVLIYYRRDENSPAYTKVDGATARVFADFAAIALNNHWMRSTIERAQRRSNSIPVDQVFLSYSRMDWDEYVKPTYEALIGENITAWVDQHVIQSGDQWLDEIGKALKQSACLILFVSPDAMNSRWVRKEYQFFMTLGRPILPVLCRDTKELPFELTNVHNQPFNVLQIISNVKRYIPSQKG